MMMMTADWVQVHATQFVVAATTHSALGALSCDKMNSDEMR